MENLNYHLIERSQITAQLSLLFQNSPRLCLKQNDSGWGTNQRILLVKNKKLIYCRAYDQFQDGKTKQISQKYYKAFISLEDIYEVNYLPARQIQKKTISIIMPQKQISHKIQDLHPLQSTQNAKKPSNQPQFQQNFPQTQVKQKLKKWVFHFEYDLKQKLSQMRQIQRQTERKKNQLSMTEQEGNQENYNLDKHNQSNAISQKSKLYVEESEIALEQYVNQLRKAKDFLKYKQNKQKMQKNQRRKNKERSTSYQQMTPLNNQQKFFPIMTHWRQFFRALQQVNDRRSNPDRTIYEYELIVYKQIHLFKQTCQKIFRNYILQKINGINSQKWQFQKFFFYKGLWIKLGSKQLNQQFLMYYYLSDVLHIFNKKAKIPYYAPDMCLVEYLGYKGLCMCDLPFSQIQKSQIYSVNNQIYDMNSTNKIKENLSYFEKVLNVKSQQIQKQRKRIPAPLGSNVKMFEYNPKRDLKADQTSLQPFYYIVNVQNLFPLDFNYQLQKPKYQYRLRPQLINDIRQFLELQYDTNTQLLSTAFMQSYMSQEQKTLEDDKVVKTSKSIQTLKIPSLMQKLNNCQLIVIDSYNLKMYMNQFGINMRYLYKLHQMANITYLRQIIEIQCLARTIKRMFYKSIKQLVQQDYKNKVYYDKLRQQNEEELDPELINMDHVNQQNQQKIIDDELKFEENAIDFLNLIFGKGQESQLFWKILVQNTYQYFQLKVPYPFIGSAGSLLHAVLYNCGIDAIFKIQIPLFKVEYPFSKANEISLRVKAKCYQFPSFQIQKMVKRVPSLETLNKKQAELFDKIALKLFKMDLLKNYYLYENDFNYHSSFSKVNIVKQEMQKPNFSNSHHPSQITYYIANKTQSNFQKALNLLNFCFSDFHPIYVSFYQQYSHFYQPELLRKTAILQSIKCFGQFHPKTTEIYAWSYSQGYQQFYKKALRSQSVLVSNFNMNQQYQKGMYYSCTQYCLKQMKMSEHEDNRVQKQNCIQYLKMLFMGMRSATKISRLQQSILISQSISDLLNKFKIRNYQYHYQVVEEILKVKLILNHEKLFLYKITLLCITIQRNFNQHQNTDRYGCLLPAVGQQKQSLATGVMNEYFTHQTHSLWLQNIIKHIMASFQYFNHLQDLFTNIEYHIQRYNNIFFKESLGYWDILIRLYGEKMFKDYLYETGKS